MTTPDLSVPAVGSDAFIAALVAAVDIAGGLTVTLSADTACVVAYALRETGLRRIVAADPASLPEGVAQAAWTLLHDLASASGVPHQPSPQPLPIPQPIPQQRVTSLELTSIHAVACPDAVEASGTATDRHTGEMVTCRLTLPGLVAVPLGQACRFFDDQSGGEG